MGDLDAIIAPVGGGGMVRTSRDRASLIWWASRLIRVRASFPFQMSGVAIAAKSLKPGIKVFGAEPKDADDAYR